MHILESEHILTCWWDVVQRIRCSMVVCIIRKHICGDRYLGEVHCQHIGKVSLPYLWIFQGCFLQANGAIHDVLVLCGWEHQDLKYNYEQISKFYNYYYIIFHMTNNIPVIHKVYKALSSAFHSRVGISLTWVGVNSLPSATSTPLGYLI